MSRRRLLHPIERQQALDPDPCKGRGQQAAQGLEHERQCLLVLIGADASGRKELVAVEDGFRASAQSWHELLLRLHGENGLKLDPELATGDGVLGCWQALHEVGLGLPRSDGPVEGLYGYAARAAVRACSCSSLTGDR